MYIDAPEDLPAPQRERWAHGVEWMRELSRTATLRRGRLVAYGVEEFWELVLRREDQMFKVDGPATRAPRAEDGRLTFDLGLEFDRLEWPVLDRLADEGIAGARLAVSAIRVDTDGVCRAASSDEPLEIHLTVGAAERAD